MSNTFKREQIQIGKDGWQKDTVDLLLVVTTDYNGHPASSSDRIPTIKCGRKNIPINGTEGNHTGDGKGESW